MGNVETLVTKAVETMLVRFSPGEDVNKGLEFLLRNMNAGFIIVPALQAQFDSVTLGFYDPQRAVYDFVELPRPGDDTIDSKGRYSRFEPTAVSGNVTWVGDAPFAHIHGAFASGFLADNGRVVGGGHVSKLVVGRTCECLIFVGHDRITRVMDPSSNCAVRVWQFK